MSKCTPDPFAVDGGSKGSEGGEKTGTSKPPPQSYGAAGAQRPTSEVQKGDFTEGREGNEGRSIRMACLTGKIFYTVDGSDPRLSGGAVSEKASEYTSAIPVTPGLRLFARVRSDFALWSAPVTFGE